MSRRLLGAAMLVGAGVTAVVGTFLPLYAEGPAREDRLPSITVTSWEYVFSNLPAGMEFAPVRSPQYGVPIVVSAVLLAVAAALVFLPESQRLAARYLAIGGTGVLVGSVWAVVAVVVSMVGNAARPEVGGFAVHVGEGVSVLGASVLLAVAGVVLVHARRREPRPEGPVVYRVDGDEVDDDTDTPPFGIPVVEVAQLPDSGYERRADGS
ncbi:hypothetical protein LZG04_07130 [Saccharothrix sp. S26]|uniref:hypothetical protein n=1 Tax=Saccharothrix sp. S26 TaxID=2907215 RepID=UPI001F177AAB|nr:hypothetical protein [Saccharothrix sp. S26]MCE6994581.1 hypothetical protein [Saccharothrix sp. S26]